MNRVLQAGLKEADCKIQDLLATINRQRAIVAEANTQLKDSEALLSQYYQDVFHAKVALSKRGKGFIDWNFLTSLANQGQKLTAVKMLREFYPEVSLLEAKREIERHQVVF